MYLFHPFSLSLRQEPTAKTGSVCEGRRFFTKEFVMGAAFVIGTAFVAVYLFFKWVKVPLRTAHYEADCIDEEGYDRWPS